MAGRIGLGARGGSRGSLRTSSGLEGRTSFAIELSSSSSSLFCGSPCILYCTCIALVSFLAFSAYLLHQIDTSPFRTSSWKSCSGEGRNRVKRRPEQVDAGRLRAQPPPFSMLPVKIAVQGARTLHPSRLSSAVRPSVRLASSHGSTSPRLPVRAAIVAALAAAGLAFSLVSSIVSRRSVPC